MSARRAVPTDVRPVADLFWSARAAPERCVIAASLPIPYLSGLHDTVTLLGAGFGLHRRARLFVETQGALRSAALVYVARRPEWVVLLLTARPDPGGADGAFRLLSAIAAAAAREGMQRLFAVVPDHQLARETLFQAGFYSYTTETWFVASRVESGSALATGSVRRASRTDAHDLFRLYLHATPHAVQRAEQLSVSDFDLMRNAPALASPHLVGGNPLTARRRTVLVAGDGADFDAMYVGFNGRGAHPHICKLRTTRLEVDVARNLARLGATSFDARHAVASPVRPYEEHLGRALETEGFRPMSRTMLFVKELAERIEERVLAPAIVR